MAKWAWPGNQVAIAFFSRSLFSVTVAEEKKTRPLAIQMNFTGGPEMDIRIRWGSYDYVHHFWNGGFPIRIVAK